MQNIATGSFLATLALDGMPEAETRQLWDLRARREMECWALIMLKVLEEVGMDNACKQSLLFESEHLSIASLLWNRLIVRYSVPEYGMHE